MGPCAADDLKEIDEPTHRTKDRESLLQAEDHELHRNVSSHSVAVADEGIHRWSPDFWKTSARGYTSGCHVEISTLEWEFTT